MKFFRKIIDQLSGREPNDNPLLEKPLPINQPPGKLGWFLLIFVLFLLIFLSIILSNSK
jgi:hypothetical protein